jgi:hypothetical protein
MEIIDENGAPRYVPEEKMGGCRTIQDATLNAGGLVWPRSVGVTGSAGSSSTSVMPAGSGSRPPMNAQERKQYPLVTGCLDYFPDALMEVAHCSWVGNEQHNPGMPLHWDRSKSTDEADALGRHLKDRGTLDTDGVRHSAKVAWRALALLQKELEAARAIPLSAQP